MENDSTFFEISRISIPITKQEDATMSWHDSILTVITEKGINLLEFSRNLRCLDKKIDMLEYSISPTKISPATGLFTSKLINSRLKNMELTELITDPALWPHNDILAQDMLRIISCEWSPAGLLYDNINVLAVLNNIGNLEIFGQERSKWRSVLNISNKLRSHLDEIKLNSVLKDSKFDDVRNAAYALESCSMCWGTAKQENQCYFVSVQKNGDIWLWLVTSFNTKLEVEPCNHYQSKMAEIITMLWIPKTNNEFVLLGSNICGEIVAFNCSIYNNSLNVTNIVKLWSCKDRMFSKHLKYTIIDSKIIVLCNKNRHLLVQMIDKDCNLLHQYVHNVNDFRITVITQSGNNFFVGTINSKIFEIKLTVKNESLDVKLFPIETKDSYLNHDLYSVSFSKNATFCALGLLNRSICNRKKIMNVEVVLTCRELNHGSEITSLLNHPMRNVSYVWDIIEIIRFKIIKCKVLPSIDFQQLWLESETDCYKLKVYLILATLNELLEKGNRTGSKGLLPETSLVKIKEKILFAHAKSVIDKLFNIYENNKTLESLQIEIFIGAKKYLEFYCQKNKIDIKEVFPQKVLNIFDTQNQYTCQCCDNPIVGFSCKKGHLNMFCCVTFTLIEDDYVICKTCNATARPEMFMARVTCPFCDSYFSSCNLPG